MTADDSARYYARNRETVLARKAAWYARNRSRLRKKRMTPEYRAQRTAYMRKVRLSEAA